MELFFNYNPYIIAGIFVGGFIGNKITGDKLKIDFGWFLLLMDAYMMIREVLSSNPGKKFTFLPIAKLL